MSTEPRCARFALAYMCAAVLLLAIGLEGRAQAATPPSTPTHSASFESALNEGTDFGWQINYPFSVTRTSEVGGADGNYAARIVTNGGDSGCSCPRMKLEDGLSYGPGDEVWIGGSWYVPNPSRLAWSRLMNLGHFEGEGDPDNWYLGLLVRDSGMSVQAHSDSGGSTSVLMPARPIPSNRWFDVDLHFVFSPTDGRALTEWYIDGHLVGATTKANMLNSTPLDFYHAGLPYFWNGNGNTTVYFDAPRVTRVDLARPSTARRSASFESTLNEGIDLGWRIPYPFSVTRTSEVGGADGNYAARIVTNGGNSGCSCPRMKFEDGFSYGPGDEVWIGGSWYVPNPSRLAWSRLMNLGHFEGDGDPDNWYLALAAREAGEMEVVARRYNTDAGQSVLMAPRAIPQDRWFDVDLHFKLSPESGQALTQVYLDGRLVTSTTRRNMLSSRRLHFYNAGLSYFWNGNGNTTVYFDAPRLTD
jgi:hypothetical protein